MLGDAVAMFPSWETLPHERLSPGVDTVGARMMVLRRLAHPDDARLGPPLRVVVTTARSLLQPMAPDLAEIEPVTLTVGAEAEFDAVIARLVDLAYTRVDMVGKRGEFAVRGGILDVFPPTAEHPVRVEFWGDEVSEMRMFSVADQRSIPEIDVDSLIAVPCRELLLTDDVRDRAAELAAEHPVVENSVAGSVPDMLAKLAEGIPVDGMEALLPVLRPTELTPLSDHLPSGTPVLICDPEKVRTRAADLIKTGREFLEASWSTAAVGGDAPIDIEALGASGFVELDDARDRGPRRRPSVVDAEPAVRRVGARARHPAGTVGARVSRRTSTRSSRCCARTSRPAATPPSSPPAPAPRTASSSSWPNPTRPQRCWSPAPPPKDGVVGVLKGPLHDGVVMPGANLVVITETDLTGNRAAATEGKRLAAKRRNVVDPLALTAGDLVVHDQHGIGRFVEMTERIVGGARREYLVLEYASSKRGGGSDKLYVPMDSLDQLSRYVGGEAPTLSRLGGSDWTNTKTKARTAVREIAARAGGAVRQAAGLARLRVRPGHPVAGRDGGRVRVHRDRRPADRHHRGQVRHGEAGADGPGDLRRRRLRQDRDRGAGGVQGGAGRQAGRGAGADDAAGRPAPADVHRADGRVPGHGQGAVAVHRPRRVARGARGHEGRLGRHRDRHPPAAADRRDVEGPRPGRGRRGAALRRRAQGAHQVDAHPRRRADHERDADPAHAGDEPGGHPRDVDDPHPARGALPGADLRRPARRQAGRGGAAARAAARRAGVLHPQPGPLHRPGRRAGCRRWCPRPGSSSRTGRCPRSSWSARSRGSGTASSTSWCAPRSSRPAWTSPTPTR